MQEGQPYTNYILCAYNLIAPTAMKQTWWRLPGVPLHCDRLNTTSINILQCGPYKLSPWWTSRRFVTENSVTMLGAASFFEYTSPNSVEADLTNLTDQTVNHPYTTGVIDEFRQ